MPFLGIGVLLTIYGFTIGDADDIKYSDSKYRLQQTYSGFLAPASLPDLFVKHGLFEYMESRLQVQYFGDSDSIEINNLGANEIEIKFYHDGQFTKRESPIKVIVEIAE